MKQNLLEYQKYKHFLNDITLSHLKNCIIAYDNNEYLSTSIWASVVLEALFEEYLSLFNIDTGLKVELSEYIAKIRQLKSNKKIILPDEIIKRMDIIRSLRNGLVHNTQMDKTSIDKDGGLIYSSLIQVLDWYISIPESRKCKVEENQHSKTTKVKMFLSTITPHNKLQELFIDGLIDKLNIIGIEVVRAVMDEYDKKDPIGKISETMSSCKGCIVLGMERSHAYYLIEKEGAFESAEIIHRKYTSGWLHVEAGIASALKKDIFVLCQKDIYGDGIFDRYWNTYPVKEFSELDANSTEFDLFYKKVQEWLGKQ